MPKPDHTDATITGLKRPTYYRSEKNNNTRVEKIDIKDKYQSVVDIVEGCRKKKRKSQKQLYHLYCDELYTTALRILNSKQMAEDAMHDAFLLVFRDIKKLRDCGSLKPWMKKIVVNTSLKMLQRYRRIEYTDKAVLIDNVYGFDPMNGEHIEKAIAALPEGYRVVFLLIEVEGYKHQEVAEMLGVSEGTSKSQLHHAKHNLMRMLKE